MGEIIEVDVNKLEFWLENYRFGVAESQADAQQKLVKTKRFHNLQASIRQFGFQANNLLTVSINREKAGFYLVYDGNRRLAAVKTIPNIETLQVYEENDRQALNAIIAREHRNVPEGQLRWTAVQQARWEKALYTQQLKNTLADNAICLDILEQVKNEVLDSGFPLTTFERLYSESFLSKFNIDIQSDPISIGKKSEVVEIYRDISDQAINSRNLNTSDNIETYLTRLLNGESQEDRTNLVDDNDDADSTSDAEEENPTRLFRPSELEILKQCIRNPDLIRELERAPINRYPHLLTLATRAVLDTLKNIDQNNQANPESFNKGDCQCYMQDRVLRVMIRKAERLVDTLCEYSHDLRKKSTNSSIDNARYIVNQLMGCIYKSMDHNR